MAKKLDAKTFSSFLTGHKHFLKTRQARMGEGTPEHDDYQSAIDSCDSHLEMCKAESDELEKSEKDALETKIAAMVDAALLKALGDRVVPNPGVSRLAPAPPRAVPRFGAPEAKAVDVPVELQKIWGGSDEDQIEV